MKAKEIQDLIDFIAKSGLDEVNIETEAFKLNVKRSGSLTKVVEAAPQAFVPVAATPVQTAVPVPTPAATTPATEKPAASGNTVTVRSPMIGTFYRSANPDSPAFVEVGDEVKKGQVLCIIEAMKLFNEIESEVSGRIVKILVDNAIPIEYDQPLFVVEPN
ncbi:MAG: acetyl-CoA carboxylase biotin carboxyl carrier protein [Cytophagales bacterium]|jgi:acetyl-CoA carboxylase biotin carboxyl carrier protein|nr:acetyl-CoA carboxylase biotin carboxyl carrier protein [Cytophagales bacterium]